MVQVVGGLFWVHERTRLVSGPDPTWFSVWSLGIRPQWERDKYRTISDCVLSHV